mmetsp:Transcript_74564/g.216312  ORF Transcript_74564/g.216312 Transcript_74564/m.216312 type:complete len:236 (-) Transcript_74564:81-788(-)
MTFEAATVERLDGAVVAIVDIVYPRASRVENVVKSDAFYYLKPRVEPPTTINGCECIRDWELRGHPACSSPENAFCCNPTNDDHGPWCPVENCGGRRWDSCEPRELQEWLTVEGAGGVAQTRVVRISDFTTIDPFIESSILLLKPMRNTGEGSSGCPLAPVTRSGCVCEPDGRCPAATGWCCDVGAGGSGPWCFTKPGCSSPSLQVHEGRKWDKCTPTSGMTNRGAFGLFTARPR